MAKQAQELDWSFMEGPEDNDRAVPGMGSTALEEEVRDFSDPIPQVKASGFKQSSKPVVQKGLGFGLRLKSIHSVDSLPRYVLFNQVDVNTAFENVCNFAKTRGNCQTFPQNKSLVGYAFEQSNYAQWRLEMFTHQAQLGLKCDRLDGLATVVTDFWNSLKNSLVESELVAPEEDPFEDEEWDSFDQGDLDPDDSGLSIPGLDLNTASYLQFTEDPAIIKDYIEDLDDPNFNLHSLLVLAWNAQQKENLQVICENYAQPLFDAVIACMLNNTLPMVRSSAKIVSELACQKAMKVSQDQFLTLIKTLNTWTLSAKTNTSEVTQSDEVAQLIAQNLLNFESLLSEHPDHSCLKIVEKVHAETEFVEVKQNLSDYLASSTLRVY